MKKGTTIIVALALGVFLCLPSTASADFYLSSIFGQAAGYAWLNNPPTLGPFDQIDTFIEAGDYVFSTTPDAQGNVGAVLFSNADFTSTLTSNLYAEAVSASAFTGEMYWDYNFAGSYTPQTPITLVLNYYNGNTFVIGEEWTWSDSVWSGRYFSIPFDPDPPAPAPIPASALLLGTGLLGLTLLGRRRKVK